MLLFCWNTKFLCFKKYPVVSKNLNSNFEKWHNLNILLFGVEESREDLVEADHMFALAIALSVNTSEHHSRALENRKAASMLTTFI